MNELYSISPDACDTGRELAYILRSFGPSSGRYVIGLPQRDIWLRSVIDSHSDLRDIEKTRLSRALDKARREGAVINHGYFLWDQAQSWVQNVQKSWGEKANQRNIYLSDADFEALEKYNDKIPLYFSRVADFDSAPSGSLSADCDAETYWKLMEVLCSISTELHFVDPYFDPLRRDRRPVFERILQEIGSKPQIKRVVFWIRHAEVAKGLNHFGDRINKDALRSALRNGLPKDKKHATVSLRFVQDESSKDKFHARYLVTNKGGVIFDQGFQVLPGRRCLVAAMSSAMKDEKFAWLSAGPRDISVEEEVEFKAAL